MVDLWEQDIKDVSFVSHVEGTNEPNSAIAFLIYFAEKLSHMNLKKNIELIGFGAQEETENTINQTKNFLKELKPHIARTFIMTPFPGSEEYEKAKKHNRLNSDKWSDFQVRNPYLLKRPYIKNEIIEEEFNGFFDKMAKKEVTNWMCFLLTHPRCMAKKLKELRYRLKYD